MDVFRYWIWRAVAAVGVGLFATCIGFLGMTMASGSFVVDEQYFRAGLLLVGFSLIPLVPALLLFHWLTVRHGGREGDGETRCRACGYILRGLSEPRCSECGERI